MDWLNITRWPLSAQLLLLAGIDAHLTLWLSRQANVLQTLLAWLLALLLFLLAILRFDQEQEDAQPLNLGWNRYDSWAILVLMLLALALRGFYLDQAPLAMHNDEAVVGVRAMSLVGKPLAAFWVPDEMSLTNIWYYLQAAFILLFGQTATGVRMFAVFSGVLTMPAAYLLVRLLFTQRMAIGAVFLLATYHFHIHFSRLGLAPIADPFFGCLVFSCLVIGLRTRRRFFFALAGMILGLALNFYTGSRLFVPLTMLLGLTWLLAQQQIWRTWHQPEVWFPWFLVGATLLVSAAPQLQAALINPHNFFVRVTVPSAAPEAAQQATKHGWSQLRFWFEQFRHALLSFYVYPESGYQGFYDKENPLMRGVAAWLMALGSVLTLWWWRQWRSQLLIGWYLLTALVGGMLMADPSAQQRYVTLTVVACLLVALALEQARQWAVRWWPRGRWATEAVIGALYINLAVTSIYAYYVDYLPRANYGTASSQIGTALAYYLRGQPTNTQAWFVGKPVEGYYRSHIPRYLASQVTLSNLTTLTGQPLSSQQPVALQLAAKGTGPLIFITAPQQKQERAVIEKWYPHGSLEPIIWPQRKDPVLFAYRLEQHGEEQSSQSIK